MNEHKKEVWLSSIKDQLDASCDELSSETLDELRQARTRALNRHSVNQPFWTQTKVFGGVASFAMIALLSWVVNFAPNNKKPEPVMISLLEDMPVMLSSQNLDFYENLDFHLWLSTEAADDLG